MKTAIWTSLLDADMNHRYWRRLAQRYICYDYWAKIFLAITASSTVAGWVIWEQCPYVWKILSGISTLIAIALPIAKFEQKIKATSYLSGKWLDSLYDYEACWLRLRSGEAVKAVEKQYQSIRAKEKDFGHKETELPEDKKLLHECQQEIIKSRGLNRRGTEKG